MDNDLTFESTTDTPEQMREGMGLSADAPVETSTVAAEVVSDVQAGTEATTTSTVTADATTAEQVVEASAEPVVPQSTRQRGPDGKFVATPKPDPIAEERAIRMVAETERDALKRRVEELSAGAPPKPGPVAAPIPAIDPETYRDPIVTTKFESARKAIGAEPKQEDFEDYTEFRKAERTYDRKLAALDARETDAHMRAGENAAQAQVAGITAAAKQFDTFREGQQASKAQHADYDAVMAAANIPFAGRPYAAAIERAVVEMGAEGAELHYYIAKNPTELDKIMDQPSVHLALTALGRLASVATAAVSAATAPAGATQTGPATTVVTAKAPVSKAPLPQGTTLGGGSSLTATTPETAKDYQEYKRIRESQIKARFGR